jgi:DegV family protein with EDD domain
MTVAIITDSAASLPPSLADAWDVRVVALHLFVNEADHLDGELPLSEVLEDPKSVTTSGPSPGEFLRVIEESAGDDGAVVLTIAGHMSSTYKAAWTAATLTDKPIKVIDTGTAAGAQGLVVLAAAEAARAGAPIDEVERRALAVVTRVRLVAAVAGLDHLQRSGRVPGLAAWAGRLLGVQPIFAFRGGRVHPLRPAQSRTAALDRLFTTWKRSRRSDAAAPGTRLHVAALHAEAHEEAEELLDRVRGACEPATAFVGQFSPVMVAHVGPGLIGLAWWWEPAAP